MAKQARQSCCAQASVHLALVTAQVIAAAASILMQVVLINGVSKLILAFYCLVAAVAVLGAVSWFTDRNRDARLFSVDIVVRLLLLGFMIFVLQLIFMVAVAYTSASFVAAIHPLSPVFTAICALLCGVETLNWYGRDGQAKILGILLCASGSVTMAYYQGPCLLGQACSSDSHQPLGLTVGLSVSRFQLGAALAIIGNIILGALGSVMAKLLALCPAPAAILAFSFTIAAAITGVAALATAVQGDWCIPSGAMFVVLLNGGFTLSLSPFLLLWSIMKLGPTIVSCYAPANPILTSVFSLLFLGTSIYLGNILGAVVLIVGLLLVSWAEEEQLKQKGINSYQDLEEVLVHPEEQHRISIDQQQQ